MFKINEPGRFQQVFSAVALAASKRKNVPVMMPAVHMRGDGAKIIIEATDRYRLFSGTVPYEGGPFDVAIPATVGADLKRAKAGRYAVLKFTTTDTHIDFEAPGGMPSEDLALRYALVEGQYPEVGRLYPENTVHGFHDGALNPLFLADFANAAKALGEKEPSMSFWQCADDEGNPMPGRPVIVRFGGVDDWVGVIMPQSRADHDSGSDLAAAIYA